MNNQNQHPMTTPIRFLLTIVVFLLIGTSVSDAMACPNCRETLAAAGLNRAYAASILFLMSMPFTILATWCLTIYRMCKRKKVSGTVSFPDTFSSASPTLNHPSTR